MPDAADEAAERIAAWNTQCLEQFRAAQAGPGRLTCEDCDTEIPERRRQQMPSATRCVKCQEIVEGRRRGR
jgi:phage/conjugal plasmid C-4 type zinc finger TraR family protein